MEHTCSALSITIDNINTVCAITPLSVDNCVCYGSISCMNLTCIIPQR